MGSHFFWTKELFSYQNIWWTNKNSGLRSFAAQEFLGPKLLIQFYLAELFRQATFNLAELFRQIAFPNNNCFLHYRQNFICFLGDNLILSAEYVILLGENIIHSLIFEDNHIIFGENFILLRKFPYLWKDFFAWREFCFLEKEVYSALESACLGGWVKWPP